MKLKILAITVLCLFSNKIISQEIENVNPKDKWYFGAEIGTNNINSFQTGGRPISFQAGILAEGYFARHWSFSFRIKYFETGVSFYSPAIDAWIFSSDESKGTFKGAVIAFPLDIKWEFRVYKNLGASLKLGLAYTTEIKSDYSDYSSNLSTNLPKQYLAPNYGIGLNYFINKKMAVYMDYEGYVGDPEGTTSSVFFTNYHYTENALINFGFKYTFKEDKKTEQSTDSDTD